MRLLPIALLFVVAACGPRKSNVDLSQTTDTLDASITAIDASADRIDTEAQAIVDLAPQPSANIRSEVKIIKTETNRLESVEQDLQVAQKNNDDQIAIIKRQQNDIIKLDATIKDLRAEKYGLISKMLAVVAALSVVAGVASIFLLRSVRLAVGCALLFSTAVAAQWLLNYALIIGLVTLAALALGAYWTFWRESKATKEVVKTVEAIKTNVWDFKAIANSIQTPVTKRIVDRIKHHI